MPEAQEILIDELHAVLGRVALVLGLAPQALAWIDDRGRIVWCNPAFGRYARSEHVALLGKPLADHLELAREGAPIVGDAHPARRVLVETTPIDEVYDVAIAEGHAVVELFGRRGPIEGQPAAVLVIQDITERARAQSELRVINTQLEAANTELEAFSYSVSHDLRTPLRAIDGFSQALLEDYGRTLPAEGRDYLQRLRAAAQNMGRLIEDLLRLSRVTRAELAWADLDVTAMCRAIGAELAASTPDRGVELAIEPGLTARGDERLLHQALYNLLANAWKFTGSNPRPRIEVGATDVGGEDVFFVRDNGVGFDMKRADKLFGAFQRLHTAEEFPGTGIGLALVRRIIHRHGGRIWADAAVGTGATFYFTLPGESAP